MSKISSDSFNIGDEVLVFKDYGRTPYVKTHVTDCSSFYIKLANGDNFNLYDIRNKIDVEIVKCSEVDMDLLQQQYLANTLITIMYWNKKNFSKRLNSKILEAIKEEIPQDEFEELKDFCRTTQTLVPEGCFILDTLKNQKGKKR